MHVIQERNMFLEHEKNGAFIQRSRMDIIACLLGNANSGSRKTRLIYKCNMSLTQFNAYEETLQRNENEIHGIIKDLKNTELLHNNLIHSIEKIN